MPTVTRLLDTIIPSHYRLAIDVDMRSFSFNAKETINFELKRVTDTLEFHAVGLSCSQVVLDKVNSPGIKISVDEDNQTVSLQFPYPIATGIHTLEVSLAGSILDGLHGFYRSSYTDQAGLEHCLATTQFEAVHAREAFMCIDEPAAKAIYDISLTVPAKYTALSNTNVVSEQLDKASACRTITFAPTPKMSSYLVAYVVGQFEHVEATTPEGVLVRAYAAPGKTAQLNYALDVAVRTLSFYTDFFGIAYPLPKLDMIAIPDFAAGAMENWGLVTYRETALLLDETQTSLPQRQRVAEVVAHELAHQWFGNLVTMRWWDDLWLNEGFATWCADLARDHLSPDWEIWTQFVAESLAYAQDLDALANTHAIEVKVHDPRHLDEIFDAVSYEKGASIIRMLHHYIGAEAFQKGLRSYLQEHQYGNTTTADLWQALEQAAEKPVVKIMSTWTGMPGFPLISFEDGELKQQRFYSSPREAARAKPNAPWPIPFTAVLPDGVTSPVLIDGGASELSDELMASEWFKPNAGQTGFYRVLYTDGMIDALAKPLTDGSLPETDRFGVADDVFATTRAGLTASPVALELCRVMRAEPSYIVAGSLLGGLSSLIGAVDDEALRNHLEDFALWFIKPNIARLGWAAHSNESTFDTLLRPMLLQQAVRYGDTEAVAQAKALYSTYLAGGPIDPNLRGIALTVASHYGATKEFDELENLYRNEAVPQIKMQLLGSLYLFRDAKLLARALNFGLSEHVRPADITTVVASAFRNRENRGATWKFVQANWPLFLERYGAGGHMLERFPALAGNAFATHAMAAEVGEFFGRNPHPGLERPVAQAVEKIQLKADWAARDHDAITKFLGDFDAANA